MSNYFDMNDWRKLEAFENYLFSKDGRIFSITSNRELKLSMTTTGYKQFAKKINGKTKFFSVHRLIATAFIPNPENKPQINHKDGNKINNSVENLEWVTSRENILHAISTGLSIPKGQKLGEHNLAIKSILYNEKKQHIKTFDCIMSLHLFIGGNYHSLIKKASLSNSFYYNPYKAGIKYFIEIIRKK